MIYKGVKEGVPEDSDSDDMTPASSVEHQARSTSRSLSRSPSRSLSRSPSRSMSRTPSRSPTPPHLSDNQKTQDEEESRHIDEVDQETSETLDKEGQDETETGENDDNILNSREAEENTKNDETNSDSSIAHDGYVYRNPLHDDTSSDDDVDKETIDGAIDDLSDETEKAFGEDSALGTIDSTGELHKDTDEEQQTTLNGLNDKDSSDSQRNVSFASNASDSTVNCADCGLNSDALQNSDGECLMIQLQDYDHVYVCVKCHEEGLKRQEAQEKGEATDLTRSDSGSSDTIPLSDVPTPPMSPTTQKRHRGRRPTQAQMNDTPVLTRSRSKRLGIRLGGV